MFFGFQIANLLLFLALLQGRDKFVKGVGRLGRGNQHARPLPCSFSFTAHESPFVEAMVKQGAMSGYWRLNQRTQAFCKSSSSCRGGRLAFALRRSRAWMNVVIIFAFRCVSLRLTYFLFWFYLVREVETCTFALSNIGYSELAMEQKSRNSLYAAQTLINKQDERLWASAIHCCYYAVLQFMHHVVADRLNAELSAEQVGSTRSHVHLQEALLKEIKHPKDKRQFQIDFEKIKRLRKSADYTNDVMNSDNAFDSKDIADKLISMLNRCFPLL